MSDYTKTQTLLRSLCTCAGVSGEEKPAADAALELLSKYMPAHIDALGNVIGEREGKGPHILLDAHLDRVGLIVTAVDSQGFLKVSKCGGSDARVLAASDVTVWSRRPLFGVITSTPPHLASKDDSIKAKDFDAIAIDIGLDAEAAREIVTPGDRVTVNGSFLSLANNRVASPCLDDRAGVAAVLRCLDLLADCDCRLTVMFSTQEETGTGAAGSGAFDSNADEAICVDVSFACAPNIDKVRYPDLGSGTMIGIAPSLDSDISNKLSALADSRGISCSVEVMGGRTGTNCDEIQTSRGGIKTALLSIPLRNMHTAVEVISLADVESTAQLMAAYISERSNADA